MTKQEYIAIIRALGQALCVPGTGGGKPRPRQPPPQYREVTLTYWTASTITLIFELPNLYLQGFRNANGDVFLFKDVTYTVTAVKKFSFTTDYGPLGLDRNSEIHVSLEDLANAFQTMVNFTADKPENAVKRPTWQCAVGLSEALRFTDVAQAVVDGTAMPDLDWSGRTTRNDPKVRVLHH